MSKQFDLIVLAQWMNGNLITPANAPITGFATDSREVKPGDMFFALKGERVDGHKFLHEVEKAGAAAVVVNKYESSLKIYQVLVKDPGEALIRMATKYRKTLKAKVVGITGSVGKTTVKEFTAAALSAQFKVVKSEGNLNTEIGLPLSVMKMTEETEIGVFEMGMRGLGQIKQLCDIAKPDIGIITNIGDAHYELLGSRDNIAKAKAELLQALPDDGIAIIPEESNYDRLLRKSTKAKILTFGYGKGDIELIKYKIDTVNSSFAIYKTPESQFQVNLPTIGNHNALNAAAAITCAYAFNMDTSKAKEGLEKAQIPAYRMQSKELNGYTIISDMYNSNAESVRAAIDTLCELAKNRGRAIAVLGGMAELGDQNYFAQAQVGSHIAASDVDILMVVGEDTDKIISATLEDYFDYDNTYQCDDCTAAAEYLAEIAEKNDFILIKGSRKYEMEKIVELLEAGAKSKVSECK